MGFKPINVEVEKSSEKLSSKFKPLKFDTKEGLSINERKEALAPATTAGEIVGGFAGAAVGHPYLGVAAGGVVGRTLAQPTINAAEGINRAMQQDPKEVMRQVSMFGLPATALANAQAPTAESNRASLQDIRDASVNEAIMTPLRYGAGKVVEIGIGAARNLFPNLGAKFAEKARETFFKYKENLSKGWGKKVEELSNANPDKVIDVADVGKKVQYLWGNLTNEAKAAFSKSPSFNKIVNGVKVAGQEGTEAVNTQLTLKETNQIISDLGKAIRKTSPKNYASIRDVKDIKIDLEALRMSAFPEMAEVSAKYATDVLPWNKIYNTMQYGNTMKGIQGQALRDPEIVLGLRKIFPKNITSGMNAIKTSSDIGKTISNPVNIALGAGGTAAALAFRKFIQGE